MRCIAGALDVVSISSQSFKVGTTNKVGRTDVDGESIRALIFHFQIEHFNIVAVHIATLSSKRQDCCQTTLVFFHLCCFVSRTGCLSIDGLRILNVRQEIGPFVG